MAPTSSSSAADHDPAHYWAVVPAAGVGARMQSERPKQYLPIDGRCMLERALGQLLSLPCIDGAVVVLAQGDRWFDALPIAASPSIVTVPGGDNRSDSVLAGVTHVREHIGAHTWTLVHDAARPLISARDVQRLIDAVTAQADALPADGDAARLAGGLLAIPVQDTLKRVDEHARCIATVPREQLWQAQTPQMFRAGALVDALLQASAAGAVVTDEASAMERLGATPLIVESLEANLKLTHPRDIALAEALLRQQAGESPVASSS